MNMKTEIKEIIEKNLPAEVGTTLKEVLIKGEVDAKLLNIAQKDIAHLKDTIGILNSKIAKYQEFDERNAALNQREELLSAQEKGYEIAVMKVQLEEANKRSELVTGFTQSLMRNTMFRKEMFHTETKSSYTDVNGIMQYPTPESTDRTETKTEE